MLVKCCQIQVLRQKKNSQIVVLEQFGSFCKWCHQESNRGHKDFQSFALPTELWHLAFICFASAKVGFFSYTDKLSGNFFTFQGEISLKTGFSSFICKVLYIFGVSLHCFTKAFGQQRSWQRTTFGTQGSGVRVASIRHESDTEETNNPHRCARGSMVLRISVLLADRQLHEPKLDGVLHGRVVV